LPRDDAPHLRVIPVVSPPAALKDERGAHAGSGPRAHAQKKAHAGLLQRSCSRLPGGAGGTLPTYILCSASGRRGVASSSVDHSK